MIEWEKGRNHLLEHCVVLQQRNRLASQTGSSPPFFQTDIIGRGERPPRLMTSVYKNGGEDAVWLVRLTMMYISA